MSTTTEAHTPATPSRPLWRRLIGFNLLSGIVLAIVGWLIGHWIGTRVHAPSVSYYTDSAGQNDIAILLGYLFGVLGFLIGLGFANYPVRRMMGHPPRKSTDPAMVPMRAMRVRKSSAPSVPATDIRNAPRS